MRAGCKQSRQQVVLETAFSDHSCRRSRTLRHSPARLRRGSGGGGQWKCRYDNLTMAQEAIESFFFIIRPAVGSTVRCYPLLKWDNNECICDECIHLSSRCYLRKYPMLSLGDLTIGPQVSICKNGLGCPDLRQNSHAILLDKTALCYHC